MKDSGCRLAASIIRRRRCGTPPYSNEVRESKNQAVAHKIPFSAPKLPSIGHFQPPNYPRSATFGPQISHIRPPVFDAHRKSATTFGGRKRRIIAQTFEPLAHVPINGWQKVPDRKSDEAGYTYQETAEA